MKPSELYEHIWLQDHQGVWHKPRPLFNFEKVALDSERNRPPTQEKKTLFPAKIKIIKPYL